MSSDWIRVGRDVGTGHEIVEVRMAVVVHGDGDEAVPAVALPNENGGRLWYPLIASDETRFDWVLQQARKVAKLGGKPVRILRFSTREPLETFYPDGRREQSG
jgi:hypothetical protein